MGIEPFDMEIHDSFGNKQKFTSIDELETFFSDEQENWKWIEEEEFKLVDLRGRMDPHFAAISTWVQQYKVDQLHPHTLRDYINGLYNQQRPPLLFAERAPGVNVMLIKNSIGGDHAAHALALLTGHAVPDFQNLQHVRLWSMLALPTAIDPEAWTSTERQKLSSARAALQRELTAQRKKIDAQQDELRSLNERSRKRYRALVARALRIASRKAVAINDSAASSIDQIRSTNSAFTEQMKLQAPVGYWTDKRLKHRNAAIGWALALIVYLLFAGCLGVWIFERAWQHAEGDFTGKHFLIVAGLGTILTLIFWISRVFMRIFLGEMHLFTDAAERSVMTQTYLSLIKEGGATEHERALILTALFRSAQDGIVREDVGGEVGIAAVAAKLLETKR